MAIGLSATLGVALLALSQLVSGSTTAIVRARESAFGPTETIVSLEAVDVPAGGLGAFVVEITFDPSAVESAGCMPMPADGLFDQAVCESPSPGIWRVSGRERMGVEPDTRELAWIRFAAKTPEGGCTSIHVRVDNFVDHSCADIPVTAQDGSVCVGAAVTQVPTPTPGSDSSARTGPLSTKTASDGIAAGNEDSHQGEQVDPGQSAAGRLKTSMAAGWNYRCYVGSVEAIMENALAGLVPDEAEAVYVPTTEAGMTFERWFPGRPDLSTIDTVPSKVPMFILMPRPGEWDQQFMGEDGSLSLPRGWSAACYRGPSKSAEVATHSIAGRLAVMYVLTPDQGWLRFIPGRPDLTNLCQLDHLSAALVLMTEPATWVSDR